MGRELHIVHFHLLPSIFSCRRAQSVIHDFVRRHVRFDAIQTQAALHIVLTCNRHTFQSKHISWSQCDKVCACFFWGGGGNDILSVCFWCGHLTAEA